ncbi:hypothetical protein BBK82_00105 [Lentzea guizhouensis]|uniref:Uncharacterized protein n=1 Tax=Lentzea guizhouensis TaxID=1586287 RepID=A0A1B2HAH7_9PSEU|nr:hypothetical protein [Lentzea guizhouensis]ANZ34716.1 hypothetical protein BBK82_00105 [Lentzea guizhouensis]
MTLPHLPARGHFETVETMAPYDAVAPHDQLEPVEQPQPEEDRADQIAVIGPIAAVVLALTISTLVLDHPAARAVAAGLATVGLITAVVVLLMGRRPEPGRHVARHARPPRD